MNMKHTLQHAVTITDIHQHLAMLYALVVSLKAKVVIELGVRGGESTVALLEGVGATEGRLISVDLNPCESTRRIVQDYNLSERWTFTQSDDLEFGRNWDRSQFVDLVFIDTSHLYEHTKKEIEVFEPLVRPGGILAFHDTVTFQSGVLAPIEEFLREHPMHRFFNYQNCNGLGIIVKP